MRILITNDDGINAPGLEVLQRVAETVAGPSGEVWTVAPAFEQSGVAHCISYTHPTMIAKMGERRFAAEGSPADCVLAGVHDVMKDARPDLVLSGVNRGNNAGENTLYSGTVGGALEAAIQGLPAIALSQFFGPENAQLDDPFEAAAGHAAALIRDLLDRGRWDSNGGYRTFYNVNFPACPADSVKGRRVTVQGVRPDVHFTVEPIHAPSGRRFVWIKGGRQDVPTGDGTDVQANLDGYISITPMRADLTAHDHIAPLRTALE
ncbi:5'/3'-nucleotidase SurE [Tropicimonas isoalkanivorans]|uniref:5'-nucleotidase SurE n=1 Tax=Tropicimonas isoalkanivorans TaxID=441112 RepID=A0A1I1KFG5_9RHOB|nr:5'/3'-nucleotidase SurE [Tropicimonas isoalkanivorans]SFC56833.1 5'-nucleotidase /3'-nucleotidase /exopolyphosphatase [Tropicimonas isoalkanivorans]